MDEDKQRRRVALDRQLGSEYLFLWNPAKLLIKYYHHESLQPIATGPSTDHCLLRSVSRASATILNGYPIARPNIIFSSARQIGY